MGEGCCRLSDERYLRPVPITAIGQQRAERFVIGYLSSFFCQLESGVRTRLTRPSKNG